MKIKPRLLLLFAPTAALLLGAALAADRFWRGLLLGLALGPILVLLVVAAGTFVLRRRFLAAQALEPPPLPAAQSWDYEIDLRDLEGNPVPATDWAGRVLVLNFWATWCTPCIAEMPALSRLLQQTADLGVQFAFISSETADVVRPFVAKKAWDLPFFVLAADTPTCFRGRAVPATFVLDRAGTIVLRHIGGRMGFA